jgi:hypothetical protein
MLCLQRPRRHRWRRVLSHDRRRVAGHYFGPIDPHRVDLGRASVGATSGPWAGIFGSPVAVLQRMPLYMARILAFPGCFRGEIEHLKAELEELKRVRGGC